MFETRFALEFGGDTLNLALAATGCDKVKHRPRLLSDNGPCYIASDLGAWLKAYKIAQVHGAPGHPQTQGKIASRRCMQRLPASGTLVSGGQGPHPERAFAILRRVDAPRSPAAEQFAGIVRTSFDNLTHLIKRHEEAVVWGN
jgi:transposase InsO family protein